MALGALSLLGGLATAYPASSAGVFSLFAWDVVSGQDLESDIQGSPTFGRTVPTLSQPEASRAFSYVNPTTGQIILRDRPEEAQEGAFGLLRLEFLYQGDDFIMPAGAFRFEYEIEVDSDADIFFTAFLTLNHVSNPFGQVVYRNQGAGLFVSDLREVRGMSVDDDDAASPRVARGAITTPSFVMGDHFSLGVDLRFEATWVEVDPLAPDALALANGKLSFTLPEGVTVASSTPFDWIRAGIGEEPVTPVPLGPTGPLLLGSVCALFWLRRRSCIA